MSFFSKLFGGGGDGGAQAKQQQQQELLRQIGIQQGAGSINSLFDSQFNDDFFGKRRQAALDYYQPQLDQQYADAQKQLEYALARAGGAESSAAAGQRGDLEQRYAQNRQQIADKALGYETGARNNVEAARAQLLGMLNATGDSSGAINSARSQMAALGQPDSYPALGDLFTTGVSALGQQQAQERANAYLGQNFSNPRRPLFGTGGAVVNS